MDRRSRRQARADDRAAQTAPNPTAASDRQLADRLESASNTTAPPPPGVRRVSSEALLSNDEVERVLGRAAEIDSGIDADAAIDVASLITAAREVGLSDDAVRQAIAEVRSGEAPTEGFFARLLVGDQVVETDMAELSAPAAAEIVDGWMRNAEGLRQGRIDSGNVRWEPDRRWSTRLRMGLGRETSGLRLDGPIKIAHSVTELGPDESLVTVKADTELVRQLGTAGVGGAGLVGAAAVLPALAITDGAVETVAAIATVGVGTGGLIAGVVMGTRLYVRQLREAMRRPIDAVNRAEPAREPAPIVDVVVDQLRKLRRRSAD